MIELRLLNVGSMTATAAVWRSGDDPNRPATVPVPAWVIETATERILVDTGLHPAAVADSTEYYDGAPSMSFFALAQDLSVADQVDLSSLTRVVLTHLHFDHAGALSLVPSGVPIVIQRREWEATRDSASVERNFYLHRDFAGRDDDVQLVDGDHDLLGDGSIELLLTPGHTPGHQSVRVGDVVIGADVAHYASSLDDLRFPPFGDDRDAQGRSAERLRGLRDNGARVFPGHDPEVLKPGPVTVGTL